MTDCPYCGDDDCDTPEGGPAVVVVQATSDQTLDRRSNKELEEVAALVHAELVALGIKDPFVTLADRHLGVGIAVAVTEPTPEAMERAWRKGAADIRTAMHAAGVETAAWPDGGGSDG